MKYILIACVDKTTNTIGWYNKKTNQYYIKYSIPEDMKFFKETTMKCDDKSKINVLLMGRNTWETIGKPLPGRYSAILTSDPDKALVNFLEKNSTNPLIIENWQNRVGFFKNREEFLEFMEFNQDIFNDVYIIGGSHIYEVFISLGLVDEIYISYAQIYSEYNNLISDINSFDKDNLEEHIIPIIFPYKLDDEFLKGHKLICINSSQKLTTWGDIINPYNGNKVKSEFMLEIHKISNKSN